MYFEQRQNGSPLQKSFFIEKTNKDEMRNSKRRQCTIYFV